MSKDRPQMKAIVQDHYGNPDVLEFQEIDVPDIGPADVLVRVHAASVNPFDWHMMTGKPYLVRLQAGRRRPSQRTRGVDFAGLIEKVGAEVTKFSLGDEVFGAGRGVFAEFAVASETRIVLKPGDVSFEQAAAVPIAAVTALQALRDSGGIADGQSVLVNGASGGVGTFAVQIARALGAEVTGICSTRNVETVRSIGAHHVIDYAKDDFTRSQRRYDLILDLVGNHSLRKFRRALSPDGVYVSAGMTKKTNWIGPLTHLLKIKAASLMGRQKMVGMLAGLNEADLQRLQEWMESGDLTSVIDRRFALNEARDAMWHQGEGHAQGKSIITVR